MGQETTQGNPTNGSVLVTGSSGFLGSRLVRNLADHKASVIAMYYHKLPDAVTNVYPICSDMSSPELLATPLRGVDTVFHLAWSCETPATSELGFSMQMDAGKMPKNASISKNLITAMEKAGTKRIIFVSAIGASRHAKEHYLREKYLSELLVLNSKIPEKLIIRPSIVFGRDGQNDPFVKSIMRVMRFPLMYPVPKSKELIAPVDADDVVRILVAGYRQEFSEASGILEVTGSEAYKVSEIFRLVSAKFGSGGRLPLGGFIGDRLAALFERDSARKVNTPRLKDYLVLASKGEASVNEGSAMGPLVPKKLNSFRDCLSQGRQRPVTTAKAAGQN